MVEKCVQGEACQGKLKVEVVVLLAANILCMN